MTGLNNESFTTSETAPLLNSPPGTAEKVCNGISPNRSDKHSHTEESKHPSDATEDVLVNNQDSFLTGKQDTKNNDESLNGESDRLNSLEALDNVDGAMFSRTTPALEDIDGAMFSRTTPALDDVDGAMFSRTSPALDDVDGAMFSRTTPALDDVDGAMFSRTSPALDDVNGAMFSRARPVNNNEKRRRKHSSGPPNCSSKRPSYDFTDGSMFSRSPVSMKRHRLTTITVNMHNKDAGIPKSPSVDCFTSPSFPVTYGNFPTISSTSSGNLVKHKRTVSALTGLGTDDIPASFDLPDSPVVKQFSDTHSNSDNDNKMEMKLDLADGALFNRVNSFKLKEYQQKMKISNENDERKNAKLLTNTRQYKSSNDLTLVITVNQNQAQEQDANMKQRRASCSLPDRLDSNIVPNFATVTEIQTVSDQNELLIAVDEDVIQREVFNPLGLQRTSVRSARSNRGEHELEFLDDRPEVDCSRKPFKLKYLCFVAFPSVSVLLFLADIGTDINLACNYRKEGDSLFFWVTLACILIPSVLMSVVDLSWFFRDDVDTSKHSWKQTRRWKVVRIVLGALSFGRIVRTVSHIYHSIRSKLYECDRILHKNRKIEERRDYCMLDVINAFTESCPQLIAQMYLMYKYRKPFTTSLGLSIVLSWLSIGWAYSCYYRYQREATHGRNDVKFYAIIVFFLAVLSALSTRICCIALFLVYFPFWIGALVLLVHFSLMFIWISFCQKPKLEGLTSSIWGKYLYYMFFAYLSIIYFINLKEGKSRYRILVYFAIYYAENCIAAAVLLWQTSFDIHKSVHEFRWSLLIVPLGMFMHILLLTLFYKCFHPPPNDHLRNGHVENHAKPFPNV